MTTELTAAATIALCALGHLNRDGWPILGTTHGARALGGFLCTLGGFLLTGEMEATLLGFALYVGFYTDMQHGEGQRARGWRDVPALIVSGCTSLLPLSAIAGTSVHDLNSGHLVFDLYVIAAGFVKPLIWFAAWRLPVKWSDDDQGLFQPTRVAAVTWGAFCGALLAIAA